MVALLDLPTEILEDILEYVSWPAVSATVFFRYRLVNRFFRDQVNRLTWKRQYWLRPKFLDDDQRKASRFTYSKDRDIEDEIRRIMLHFLLSSLTSDNVMQHGLRLAMAVLMNIKEFLTDYTSRESSNDMVQIDDGFIESYATSDSHKRFHKIAALLVETLIYVSGPELKHWSWYPEWFVDGLPCDFNDDWTDPWSKETFHGLNLDWALATAVMVNDKRTINVLIQATRTFDGYVILADTSEAPENPITAGVNWKHDDRGPAWANALAVAVRAGNYELATLLMDNYINLVNAYTTVPQHDNALDIACQMGSFQMVDLILDPSRGLDHTSWHAFYAIQAAAKCSCSRGGPANCEERLFIIRLLLDLQSFERRTKVKNEALKSACAYGCITIVRTLVEDIGADPAGLDEMVLGCAATHGHVEIMEYLLSRDSRQFPLFFAVYDIIFNEAAADHDMMTYLEETKASFFGNGPVGPVKLQYLLSAARKKGCTRVADLLVQGGAHD